MRYYVNDEPQQGAIATRIMSEEPELFVSKTVVAELEWVLRGYFELTPDKIHAVLRHLLGLGNVTIEQADAVETALRYYQKGIDFADALHLASSQHCSMLLTFDDRNRPPRQAPGTEATGHRAVCLTAPCVLISSPIALSPKPVPNAALGTTHA